MQLQQNTLFADRYLLKRLLGRGGFSEIWLADDQRTHVEVAVKIYAPGTGLDDDGIDLFSQEFSIVFNLNHSNLLRPSFYDCYERQPYLILPFCERGSVAKLVGKMNEAEIWKFLKDMASALAYLHAQNPPIVHQDIKPDNVLVDSSGHYMLTDFGISTKIRSTLRKSVNKSQSSGGTIAYMAPERFGKTPAAVKASDVWSLGATVFELMIGDVPFGEQGGLIQKGGAEIPEIQSNFSDKLKNVVCQCLSKETWDRPSAEQLCNGENIVSEAPIEKRETQQYAAQEQPPAQPKEIQAKTIGKPTKSNKWIIPTAVIVAIAVFAGILFYSLSISSAESLFKEGQTAYEAADYEKAIEFFQKSADKGFAKAQSNLGECYYEGKGVTQDYTEAVKWYRKAAEQGDEEAQYGLSLCYSNGDGVTKDYTEAIKWLRKAAEQGLAKAQNNLGVCYANGNGVTQDDTEAVNWFRKAAEQGYASAQSNLGWCYYQGNGVTQDYTEAVKWLRKAAGQGHAAAQYNLGNCYYEGNGVTQDYTEAMRWCRKAAEQGLAYAQYNLGYCYAIGKGVMQDYTEAVKWYRKAAEQGHAAAQYNLGLCYAKGNGVTKDYTEAVKWYRKAAEQGHAEAQRNLGYCYYDGEGVTQDNTEAVKWFRKAAEQGDASAQYILGVCYYFEIGIAENKDEAFRWWKKAAAQGDKGAIDILENGVTGWGD